MTSPAPLDPPRAEEPGQLDPNTTTMRPPLLTTRIAVSFVGSHKCVCVCLHAYVTQVCFCDLWSMKVNKLPPLFYLHCAACLTGNWIGCKTVWANGNPPYHKQQRGRHFLRQNTSEECDQSQTLSAFNILHKEKYRSIIWPIHNITRYFYGLHFESLSLWTLYSRLITNN